ncbi:MAG TPA: LCP family protein [Solirubrobacteraceae bacterium]|nr:LCP family protein [Solirubrobacteraceae bacterium]
MVAAEETGRPHRGPWRRFLLGSLAIVALTTIATVAAVLLEVKHVADLIGPATLETAAGVITPAQAGSAETILVIGTDARQLSKDTFDRSDPPHSDTLLLIRMDPGKNQTSELSVPRDLRTTITMPNGSASMGKINSAYTYGGVSLAAKTVESTLPGIQINHIISVNFAGFRKLIDAIGCVYVYVDRHYYNVNTGTALDNYASIDIQPGYQQLCGQPALDYVRYRHTDSDFVRVARQQDFVRQAKQQIGVQGLLDKEDLLLSALHSAVATDIHGTAQIFHLFTLAAFSLGRPIRQVAFQSDPNVGIGGVSYVVASPAQIRATVSDFLNGNPPSKITVPTVRLKGATSARTVAGLGLSGTPAGDTGLANVASVGLPFRMYAPSLRVQSTSVADDVRAYALRDESGREHRAYVISIARGLVGEFYGIEGTNWLNPPILAGSHESRRIGGRTYGVYLDGSHIRVVSWKAGGAVYWLNNTEDTELTNRQMLAIAESCKPIV